jgi:HD-like signal output (HDOD) protein/ActR/RegA family two-component response regulator
MTEISKRPSILFVDDEPMILDGLRRMLRGMRRDWAMEFIEGGVAALERLASGPVDAIVCDMRMPTVDGATVLKAAADKHPESVRIVLSGYSDKADLLRALGPAHQVLSKPAEADQVLNTLRAALDVRARLPVSALRGIVSTFRDLPVPSDRYFELLQELDDPLSSSRSVALKIEKDLSLSARVLRLANSAFFSLPRTIAQARDAVEILGVETVRALLTVSHFYLTEGGTATDVERLGERSLRIGQEARRVATLLGLSQNAIANAATAGLLSHIGTLAFMNNNSRQYEVATARVDSGSMALIDAERAALGVSHCELGAYLTGIWGFPTDVVNAVAFHHSPREAGPPSLGPLTAVHIAQRQAAVAPPNGPSDSAALFHYDAQAPDLDVDYLIAVAADPNVWGPSEENIHELGVESHTPRSSSV